MPSDQIQLIAREMGLRVSQVEAVASLLDEDATIPFIARYRKDATGSLDEVAVATIRDRLDQLAELDRRRSSILGSLEERGLLTDELRASLEAAPTLSELEDLYLPYRPKRRTRATIARERGLEPLAQLLFSQKSSIVPQDAAARFIDPEKGVSTAEEALAGARDILAEMVSEDAAARAGMRRLFTARASMVSTVARDKKEEGEKYRDYFEWKEPTTTAPSHRILAMLRGESEGILRLSVRPPEKDAIQQLRKQFVKSRTPVSEQVDMAVQDGYRRLLGPSMETELRGALKQKADAAAIRVFAENLRELLLAPPLGPKHVLGIDPGFRTGCKVVCLDRQGKLLQNETIFPHTGEGRRQEAALALHRLCTRFGIEVIAVGNGTAGRETESFLESLNLPGKPPVVMVNESGASIYSASEVAREEFPDQDLTVRGAVSIGRRLMDPLAELVKIDPKAIGVGQYQHDVDQGALKRSLDQGVESCVNRVGVDVNRASRQLLTYVSGLGPKLAESIVEYRNEHGAFTTRERLKKVKGLGPKAFEQAAGFLRIQHGENPLDSSAVHPESYPVVDAICRDLRCTVPDLLRQEELRKRIRPEKYVTDRIGLPTLRDILDELAKPGRDPRQQFEAVKFAEGISSIEAVKVGMKLPGVVTNVTAFGAFVDIGVHQDGLVHVSQLADRFVRDPAEVVKVQQRVTVTVLEVDISRRRISLSMKSDAGVRGG